jgi:hypothetical protein
VLVRLHARPWEAGSPGEPRMHKLKGRARTPRF